MAVKPLHPFNREFGSVGSLVLFRFVFGNTLLVTPDFIFDEQIPAQIGKANSKFKKLLQWLRRLKTKIEKWPGGFSAGFFQTLCDSSPISLALMLLINFNFFSFFFFLGKK